eukprot:270522_1
MADIPTSCEAEFEFEPEPSHVDGHHILDDIQLQTINETDQSNELVDEPNSDDGNDDTNSICTFKSTISRKSDPLHQFLFSMHQDASQYSNKQPTKNRKRSFQEMIGDTHHEHNIVEISSSSSNSSGSIVSITYNSSHKKRRTISNLNRNDTDNNLHWRWDPHIFRGNTAICFRLKGVYHPAQIQTVTTNYFLLKTQHPDTLTPVCFKFKYNDYIKDKQRVISLVNASQMTQTQSQHILHTQPLIDDDNHASDSQLSELDLHLSLSEDDDDDDLVNKDDKAEQSDCTQQNESLNHTDHNQQNNIASDIDKEIEHNEMNESIEEDDDLLPVHKDRNTIGLRVKQHRRQIYSRIESDTSEDESVESSVFDIEDEFQLNHNVKSKRKRRKKRLERSDEEEDSDAKRTYADEQEENSKIVKKKAPKVQVLWTTEEENAISEGYKKYKKYRNVVIKMCDDPKYKQIFAKNNRTRRAIDGKWYRMKKKRKARKKRMRAKRKRKRKKKKLNDKSEDDKTEASDS